MPLPLAAIATGTKVAESIANPLFAHLTNVKNRKFAREMYGRQRQDALADWQMQNEYNSPRQMMQRFQEAGLNPNLIYGQMSEASPVRSASSGGGQGSAPRFESPAMDIYNMERTKAQTDLTALQMEIGAAEIALKKSQVVSNVAGAALTEAQKDRILLELGIETELRDTTIEAKKVGLESMKQSVVINWARNNREEAMNSKSLLEITERIHNHQTGRKLTDQQIKEVKQRIELLKKDNVVRELDAKLAREGVRPNDSVLMRDLAPLIHEIFNYIRGVKTSGEHAPSFEKREGKKEGESMYEWRKRTSVGKHK